MRRALTVLFPPLLVAVMSLGYRLPKTRTQPQILSPTNIYAYDSLLLVSDSAEALLARMESYVPPTSEKWVGERTRI